MDLKEVKELIELVSEKGFAEFEIEHAGFRLHIIRSKEPSVVHTAPAPAIPATSQAVAPALPAPVSAPQPAAPSTPVALPAPALPDAQLQVIKSPIVGTFYRAPSPTAEVFVKVGDQVEPDTVVCIIEAMKLMNEIQAEIRGEIVKILVENGQPVEYGQPLFEIKV